MEIQEINKALEQIPAAIELKTEEVIQAREKWKIAKQAAEYAYAQAFLTGKAVDDKATQGDLDASATSAANGKRLEVITAQSVYERREKELQRLRDNFDAMLENSYNWRAHLKKFGGGQ